MTSDERRALRQALIAAGFRRTKATHDDGSGIYTERYMRLGSDADMVVIHWGEREPDRGPSDQEVTEAIESIKEAVS